MNRVKRIGVLRGSRCAKEICLRSRGEYQKVTLILLSFSDSDRPGLKIDGHRFAKPYIDVGMLSQHRSQTEGGIGCGKFSGRNLIEQRLELLIIVFVDQCDADVRARCQLASTVQSGETTADDHYVFHTYWILLIGMIQIPRWPLLLNLRPVEPT